MIDPLLWHILHMLSRTGPTLSMSLKDSVDSGSFYKGCVEMAAFHGTHGCLQQKIYTLCGLHKDDALAELTTDFFCF